jgi:hypothetical protein
MKIIEPFPIVDANLVSSNIIEAVPSAVSAVSYAAYAAGTTYSASAEVCHTFTAGYPYIQYGPEANSGFSWRSDVFTIYTANASGTLNREPGRVYQTGTALPGFDYWTLGTFAEKYSASKSYALGAIVGYINGATGAFYQSLAAGNVGHTPSSSPTYWRQTTGNSYASWSGATTYALDEQVAIITGQMASVFTSLQAANLNKNPASEPTWWRYEGNTYKAWAAATTYAAGDVVVDLRTHHEYESAAGSNTNHDPTDSANVPIWWLDRGATSRWAMFDTRSSSYSSFAEEIDVTVQLEGVADAVALLGLSAQSVRIITDDAVLDLDFTTGALDPRITASGGSNATRVNSSGLIVAATTPRFDYDPVTLAARGLLVEAARTNLILRSEEFDNAAWGLNAFTVTANNATSPDGTSNADTFLETANSLAHQTSQPFTFTAAVHTYSEYIKPVGRQWFRLMLFDGTSFKRAYFDVLNGVIGTVDAGVTARLVNAGGGFYRASITYSCAAGAGFVYGIGALADGGVDTYAGDITKGYILWGAQVEVGSTASSYIKTTTASVTRSADSLSMTGTNFSSWFNAGEGAFVVRGTSPAAGTRPLLSANNNTSNEAITIYTSGTDPKMLVTDGGVSQADIDAGSVVASTSFTIAAAYKANDFAVSVAGGAVVTDASGTLPTIDRLIIGADAAGNSLDDCIVSIKYYNERASDVDLAVGSSGQSIGYDVTFDLTDNGSVTDWRHYFFDPLTFSADLIINDLPPIVDQLVRVIISNPGAEARCGVAAFGYAEDLGGTIYGATAGILSFSRKTVNDFGDAKLIRGANSKRGDFRVSVRAERVDAVLHKLSQLDAVGVLYQGTDMYAATWAFGFYRDHSLSIDAPSHSLLTIQIEGLV